jgi:hypothetical protein
MTGARTTLTPEQARDIRARAWAFVFQCWQEKQKAAHADRPERPERIKDDPARAIIPKPR